MNEHLPKAPGKSSPLSNFLLKQFEGKNFSLDKVVKAMKPTHSTGTYLQCSKECSAKEQELRQMGQQLGIGALSAI